MSWILAKMKLLDNYYARNIIFWVLMIPIFAIQIWNKDIFFKDNLKNIYLLFSIGLIISILFTIYRVRKMKKSSSKKERGGLWIQIIFFPLLYIIVSIIIIYQFASNP